MSGYRIVARPEHILYLYDGSIAGFYCCVHESVYAGELPMSILPDGNAQPTLFPSKSIQTDKQKALRVRGAIEQKISPRALELIETVFFSCLEEKERQMLQFVLLGFERGKQAPYLLGHAMVAPLLRAEKHLFGERQLLLGFVRFTDYGDMLVSTITPKNFILPFIAAHFIDRYSNEKFLIHDKTHRAALVYQQGRSEIVRMESLRLQPPPKEEQAYKALWKRFYDTIAIEARINPKCRMAHMPKRYWENMDEMQEP